MLYSKLCPTIEVSFTLCKKSTKSWKFLLESFDKKLYGHKFTYHSGRPFSFISFAVFGNVSLFKHRSFIPFGGPYCFLL